MQYRTVDDMFERGTLVTLSDVWTPALAPYRGRYAVIIDIEVLGYPRTISRQENGTAVCEKYDCIYTVALGPREPQGRFRRSDISVIRVISLDVKAADAGHNGAADFAAWCVGEFCGVEPEPLAITEKQGFGGFIGGAVLPHTIPMYEARHRPTDHRNKSLAAIEQVRLHIEQSRPDVLVLASTHWMPKDGFFIDDGALHEDGCDDSYEGVEPQLFSFPGDPELARFIGGYARTAGLSVRRIHRVAQEHAVWVPGHLLCPQGNIPLVPCSIWWRGPREAHLKFGEIIRAAVETLGRRAFFIASGGLSHTFDFSKPPEYVVPDGERFDRLAAQWLEKGQHGRLLDMSDDDFERWNPEGRAGHLYMLRGALGEDVKGKSLCYQGSNGTGYLTMIF